LDQCEAVLGQFLADIHRYTVTTTVLKDGKETQEFGVVYLGIDVGVW
jgi:hypothetical protein